MFLSFHRQAFRKSRTVAVLVTLWAFLLQAIVPMGYMPASLANEGTLIKFCPEGVSPELMALFHNGSDRPVHTEQSHGHMSHHKHPVHAGHDHHQVFVDEAADAHSTDIHSRLDQNSAHNHHGENSWQSSCDFGLAKTGFEMFVLDDLPQSANHPVQIRYQSLVAADIRAVQYRKQQQRAPPVIS